MAVFQLPKGGWTALMYAARQNSKEAVAALADVHADLNATTKQEGTTALQIAIINIHYDLANLLLERGADPNVVDASGMTALYAAVDMRAPANMLTQARAQAARPARRRRRSSNRCSRMARTRTFSSRSRSSAAIRISSATAS